MEIDTNTDADAIKKEDAEMVVEVVVKNKKKSNDGIVAKDSQSNENIIDIDKLLLLLEASKKAGEIIAFKQIMLLIGLTGAGKVSEANYVVIR